METPSTTALLFQVRRCRPELVAPAKPTPHEFKQLSDIDDQEGLRFQVPLIQFFRYSPSMNGRDPAKVLREAIAKTLVFYYPFAGRLREGPGRKLFVECTGEGIIFIEADADVTLEQFGDVLKPPFPCFDELLYDVPNSGGVLNCPLLLIQVTRLNCGGFIFALRLNHTMSDGVGLVQFMNAIGEMASGARAPSVLPVWQRALLNARDPPTVTHIHREYDDVVDTKATIVSPKDMILRSFFFGPSEISTIRNTLPIHLRHCSTFEIITACLWRCRVLALQPDPEEEVRVGCIVNARSKFNPPIPSGYYGNVFAYPAAVTTAGKLRQNSLDYALKLVRSAKADVTEEYMKSVADFLVIKGRPSLTSVRSFIVSDLTKVGLNDVDYGWGKPIFSGPVIAAPAIVSFYIPFKKSNGDKGIVVLMNLPRPAMEIFVVELDHLLKAEQLSVDGKQHSWFIKSAL